MGFIVKRTLTLIPGTTTFAAIPESRIWLKQRGWASITVDAGPPGKITQVEQRVITWYLDGKPGANEQLANFDVDASLQQLGFAAYVLKTNVALPLQNLGQSVGNFPTYAAQKIGEQAGTAVQAFGKGAVPGGSLTLFAGAGAVTVAVVGVLAIIGLFWFAGPPKRLR